LIKSKKLIAGGGIMKKIVVVVAGITVFPLVSIGATAQTSQRVDVPKRSKICKVSEPFAPSGGVVVSATTITRNNDGNPCWYMRRSTQSGRVFGVPMHLTKQPSHGAVEITVLDKGTRISYKPTAGFAGTDEFSVINEMYNVDRPYKVSVSR
jgi:hypothetical protein